MCQQCSARINIWNEVFRPFVLGRATVDDGKRRQKIAAGQWCLIVSNDPSFLLSIEPRPCPVENFVVYDSDEFDGDDDFFTPELEQWEADAEVFSDALSASPEYVNLVLAAQRIGFETSPERFSHINFGRWMFHFLGLLIQQNPEPLWPAHADTGHDLSAPTEMLALAGIDLSRHVIEYCGDTFRVSRVPAGQAAPVVRYGVAGLTTKVYDTEEFPPLINGATEIARGTIEYCDGRPAEANVLFHDEAGCLQELTLKDYCVMIARQAAQMEST